MALTMVSAVVWASSAQATAVLGDFSVESSSGGASFNGATLTLHAGVHEVSMASPGSTTAAHNIVVDVSGGPVDVTLDGVAIDFTGGSGLSPAPILTQGGTDNVIVRLAGSNTLAAFGPAYFGGGLRAGLEKTHSGQLTITSADGNENTTGSLTAAGGEYGAGIGGGRFTAAGDITIAGGTVTASSHSAAAIGGGGSGGGDGREITISGGTVLAKSQYGAGIGGGSNGGLGQKITISGGAVSTTSGNGAGIGGGGGGTGSNIAISGGTVSATSTGVGGDGIGSGYGANPASNVTVSGSDVDAPTVVTASTTNSSRAALGGGAEVSALGGAAEWWPGLAPSGLGRLAGSGDDGAWVIPTSEKRVHVITPVTTHVVSYNLEGGHWSGGSQPAGAPSRVSSYDSFTLGASEVPDTPFTGSAFVGWTTESVTTPTMPLTISGVTGPLTLTAMYGSIDTGDFVVTTLAGSHPRYTYSGNTLTLTDGSYRVSMNPVLSGAATTSDSLVIDTSMGSVDVTLDGVAIDFTGGSGASPAPILTQGGTDTVTVRLAGSNTLTAFGSAKNSGGARAGLEKTHTGKLFVTSADGDKNTTGSLTATGGEEGAGIGGGKYQVGSGIWIIGGTVTTSSIYGAGIGGGYAADGKNLDIVGGVVTTFSGRGAGIGGGEDGAGSDIAITGGTVAASSFLGDGIGSGLTGSPSSNVMVSGTDADAPTVVTAFAGMGSKALAGTVFASTDHVEWWATLGTDNASPAGLGTLVDTSAEGAWDAEASGEQVLHIVAPVVVNKATYDLNGGSWPTGITSDDLPTEFSMFDEFTMKITPNPPAGYETFAGWEVVPLTRGVHPFATPASSLVVDKGTTSGLAVKATYIPAGGGTPTTPPTTPTAPGGSGGAADDSGSTGKSGLASTGPNILLPTVVAGVTALILLAGLAAVRRRKS